jgi:hypothetical protein
MVFVLKIILQIIVLTFILMCFSSVVQEEHHKLYFDMDGNGGWVPFLTAAEPGVIGIVTEITAVIQRYSHIKFIPLDLPQKFINQLRGTADVRLLF